MAQLASRPPAQKAQPATPLPLSPHPRNPNSRPHPSPLPTPLSPLSIRSGSREHSRAPFDTNRRRLEVQSPEPPSRSLSASTTSPPVAVDRPRPPPHGSPPSLDAHVPLQTAVRPSASASPLPFFSSADTALVHLAPVQSARLRPSLPCGRARHAPYPVRSRPVQARTPSCSTTASATPSPHLPLLVVPCHELQQLLLCCGAAASTTAAPALAHSPWSRPLAECSCAPASVVPLTRLGSSLRPPSSAHRGRVPASHPQRLGWLRSGARSGAHARRP